MICEGKLYYCMEVRDKVTNQLLNPWGLWTSQNGGKRVSFLGMVGFLRNSVTSSLLLPWRSSQAASCPLQRLGGNPLSLVGKCSNRSSCPTLWQSFSIQPVFLTYLKRNFQHLGISRKDCGWGWDPAKSPRRHRWQQTPWAQFSCILQLPSKFQQILWLQEICDPTASSEVSARDSWWFDCKGTCLRISPQLHEFGERPLQDFLPFNLPWGVKDKRKMILTAVYLRSIQRLTWFLRKVQWKCWPTLVLTLVPEPRPLGFKLCFRSFYKGMLYASYAKSGFSFLGAQQLLSHYWFLERTRR